jgi:uncharacterized alkaline shock family protein YloU
MSEEKKVGTEVSNVEAGGDHISFADDVIATIAALAVSEVEGVSGMSGGVVEGITEILGKKSYTKGVKVKVTQADASVDISVSIKYGYKLIEVCNKILVEVRNAIESMTGLRVVDIKVLVSSVTMDTAEQQANAALKAKNS